MPFIVPEMAKNAKGGTELMQARLEKVLESRPDLLEHFNFHPSRLRNFDPNKQSIYWVHDLAEDPEVAHLAGGGWKKFDLIVFVSNWQFQQYQSRFGLDGSNCIILQNGIEPFGNQDVFQTKWQGESAAIRLIYHTTPHRGLEILVPAFISLWEEEWKHETIPVQLDVFSSFGVYGWAERDAPYEFLFEQCREHPAINYHGSVENSKVREALMKAHIFAYPSIWPETSCLALIEAMQAHVHCIHPNLGALFETSGGLTCQYPFMTDPQTHYEYFRGLLKQEVSRIRKLPFNSIARNVHRAAEYSERLHNWAEIGRDWIDILDQLKETVETPSEVA